MKKSKEIYEEQSKIFKALGHPDRLLMADLLREAPRTVSELQAAVGTDMSTVSKHLRVLKEARVVKTEKVGNTVRYSLQLCCLDSFLSCTLSAIQTHIEQNIQFLKPHATKIPSK